MLQGTSAVLALRAPPGSPFCLVASPLAAGPSPFGWLWVDLAGAANVASAVTGASGFAVTFSTGSLPLASVFAAQAAVLLPAGLSVSEPAVLVVQ